MSDLRTEIVSKVLNSWDTPPQTAAGQTISENIFNYVTNNPSCTSTDVVEGTSTDLGRASATLLALYQKGKIDRKKYPNPNPDGKRDNVFVYWATVDSYKEKGVLRLVGKPKKEKKVKALSAPNKVIKADVAPQKLVKSVKPKATKEAEPKVKKQTVKKKRI